MAKKLKTFNEISNEVPILKELERLCELRAMDQYNSLSHFWYQVAKPIVTKNVGSNSPNPDLSSSEVYDTVYHHLAEKLGL